MKYNVSQIILRYDLDTKSRKQQNVYNRMLFCDFMVNKLGVQLEKVGLLIRRHHAQVIYNVKQHDILKNDQRYKELNIDLMEDLQSITRIGKFK
jgi:hypothetical protein